jgi:hypothetical protein
VCRESVLLCVQWWMEGHCQNTLLAAALCKLPPHQATRPFNPPTHLCVPGCPGPV